MRLLLLGGTSEARALAAALPADVDVISSLAGRVPNPALPVGDVRIGGFGGVDGLRQWLRDERVDAVVDATHPFAATITANAATACADVGVPHLVLVRPAWDPGAATVVASAHEASEHIVRVGFSRVFLTSGRSSIGAFTFSEAWFLIRVVTAPDPATLPARHQVILSRGPYRLDDEIALLSGHHIDALVTKNSGGALTQPKLDAANALGVPVVMIARPVLPSGVRTVSSVDDALAWVRQPG